MATDARCRFHIVFRNAISASFCPRLRIQPARMSAIQTLAGNGSAGLLLVSHVGLPAKYCPAGRGWSTRPAGGFAGNPGNPEVEIPPPSAARDRSPAAGACGGQTILVPHADCVGDSAFVAWPASSTRSRSA